MPERSRRSVLSCRARTVPFARLRRRSGTTSVVRPSSCDRGRAVGRRRAV
jgi:hypothetical protein